MTDKEFVLDILKRLGRSEAEAFRAKAINENLDGTAIIDNERLVPEWRMGVYAEIGAPVRHDGKVYKVMAAHNSKGKPDMSPEKSQDLFDILST